MKSELAYLTGSYFGDGHVDYKNYAYQFILVSEDLDFLVYNSKICEEQFGKSGKITPVKNYFKLVVCSKVICNFLLSQCCTETFKKANKFEKKGKLPTLETDEEKTKFIQGLMDADGWISKRPNGKYTKYEIGFKNTSTLSPSIYEMMLNLGLSCTKISHRNGDFSIRNGKHCQASPFWSWYITPHNYISKVGFHINRKKELSKQFLKDRGYDN